MRVAVLLAVLLVWFLPGVGVQGQSGAEAAGRAQAAALRARIEAVPRLRLRPRELKVALPAGQELGMVSWLAPDPKTGDVWLIQRGPRLIRFWKRIPKATWCVRLARGDSKFRMRSGLIRREMSGRSMRAVRK